MAYSIDHVPRLLLASVLLVDGLDGLTYHTFQIYRNSTERKRHCLKRREPGEVIERHFHLVSSAIDGPEKLALLSARKAPLVLQERCCTAFDHGERNSKFLTRGSQQCGLHVQFVSWPVAQAPDLIRPAAPQVGQARWRGHVSAPRPSRPRRGAELCTIRRVDTVGRAPGWHLADGAYRFAEIL